MFMLLIVLFHPVMRLPQREKQNNQQQEHSSDYNYRTYWYKYWLIAYPPCERILCNWAIYAIISTSYFVGLIVTDVGTSELHFCSLHWIQKYLNPKKLWPVQNPLILYYPHAYPPAILSHPMHALPLFCFTPCMPSPCSVSHMHALPLFYPTSFIPFPLFYLSPCIPCLLFYPSPCIPSPYSIPPYAYPAPHSILIPAHAYLPPILSHPMHTLPPFYPSSCTLSPYSIPAYTHPPPILFLPIHALPLFYPTVCMSSPVLFY